MTLEGVQLGRRLFYDPILSGDSTMSCSSCHLPAGNFTDNKAVSIGIDGIGGRRSAMALLNVAYNTKGFFWDGRAPMLGDQVLKPVEDVVEMHNTWTNAMEKLRYHPDYPVRFRQAFGIADCSEMTKELAAKAKPGHLIAFPSWQSDTEARLALAQAGLTLRELTRAYSPAGYPELILYQIDRKP